jgi:glycosyltransferase involved in cell wall biosynthesis
MSPTSRTSRPGSARKRIAVIVPALEESGGVRSVAEFVLCAIRSRPDFEIKLISLSVSSTDAASVLLRKPASWLKGVQMREGQLHGEPFVHVGALAGEVELQRLRPRAELQRLVSDCDLIQIVAGAPCWAMPVLGLGVPIVLQVATLLRVERRRRAAIEHGVTAAWRRAMTRASSRLDEVALRAVDAVLVENPWMLSYAEACARDPQIIRYAPPGVDVSRFTALEERVPAEGYILSVGRLDDPRKNVGLLLEAYGLLCARMNGPPRLVLAGASGPDAAFWRRAYELGVRDRVEFRERPSDAELADLYRRAQTFALASDEEGFGVVVIEAMASGLPVVSTRSGGPDAIVLDGADGFLVARDDAEAMADRLMVLATQVETNLAFGRRALLKASGQYSAGVAAKAYLDTYDELLARGAQSAGDGIQVCAA